MRLNLEAQRNGLARDLSPLGNTFSVGVARLVERTESCPSMSFQVHCSKRAASKKTS